MVHRSPAPEATTALFLALLLLLFPRTSSTTTTTGGAPNTAAPCAPAWCGDLAISYPFWLAGTHPPKCGYDQGFEVTCDKAKAYLKNSTCTYQIQSIFYAMNLLRVAIVGLLSLDDGTCNVDKFVNASFVPSPAFEIEPQQNQELFFVYDCNLRAPQLPRSWTPLRCGNNGSFTWLSGQYRPEDSSMALPGNCNVAMIPVVAYEGATAADYQRLVEGGFFLSYYLTDTEDHYYYGQCQACSYRAGHGQCRTIVSDDGFQCYCSDGVYSTTACGTKRANWKTTIVGPTTAAASLLVLCICLLLWKSKVKNLWFLLAKKTSSSANDRNTEALIESYGSLAPKRYKYSEVLNITSSLDNKLGEGGYGAVYKGRLHDDVHVAVKFLRACSVTPIQRGIGGV
uniref:Wall-associated receptor kinase galacturonan-binding domain-containing protein n=1 Tax=Zea mays TaxID=4577 RepID=A0A804QK62_MAIZE|eukprot:XP_020398461.1 LEAF RUST 10 DISEASE-RESISTANCE LOCUS RECEPTOR-LIKE PROTEIN KINASE-like 2.3 isoform X1 [Zea mays]